MASLVRDLKSFAIHLHNVSFVSAEGSTEVWLEREEAS